MTKERWIAKCKERVDGFYVKTEYTKALKATAELIADYIDKENRWNERMFEGHRLLADALLDVYEYAQSDFFTTNEVVPPIKDVAAYADFVITTAKPIYIKYRSVDENCDLEKTTCIIWALTDTANKLVRILKSDDGEN